MNETKLSYSGQVKITLKQGDQVLSIKNYKNSGAAALFRFIGYCLAGNYTLASRLRPFKIKLLQAHGDAATTPNANTTYDERSIFIDLASAPEIINSATNCQVKLSFIFPIANVSGSGANIIALYGADVNDIENFSAYYRLTKPKQDSDGEIEWDPIIIRPEDKEENKVFAVEWTMTISNK